MSRSKPDSRDELSTAYQEFRALADEMLALSEALDSRREYDAALSQKLGEVREAMNKALERYKRLVDAVDP